MPAKKQNTEIKEETLEEDESEVTEEETVDDDRSVGSSSSDDDDLSDDLDSSAEINVEELIARVDSVQGNEAKRAREIHRRLEEIKERREAARNLADSFDFDFD